ncbi:MAG: PIN domain-containing protein [Rhodoplanes sp.]|uniref:type II toxin-antitoxin system VapC family toxin n=1 Tax=Rhodoplanes sp. TaxID=1968906 RepID=UPI0017E51138|nr:TA system VapC family ribonuclease toxin [Rhodoplanes sp.]NVO14253.1 PIN domain-containing protein [Rhodoplanes sp.]
MIAVDTNILVYAHREDSPFHGPAERCLRSLAEGSQRWAIPWPCLHEFLAIVTHPRIYDPPTPITAAVDQVDAWFESPTLVVLGETERHWFALRALVTERRIVGARVHDARILALCRQHAVRELWSADRDFKQFSGGETVVVNPLFS